MPRIPLIALLLALSLPAAAQAAPEPVMSGTTDRGEPYRVLLALDEEASSGCLTAELERSGRGGARHCYFADLGSGDDANVDAEIARSGRRPWLTFGAITRSVARVRVVYDDLTSADAQVVDPSSAPDVRLFHLPVPAGRKVKLVDAFDAAGALVDAETKEEGPYRLLHETRVRSDLRVRLATGWSLRAGDLAPLVCVRPAARVGRRTRTGDSDCSAAGSEAPWWSENEVAAPGRTYRVTAKLLYGGVVPAARRVRVHLSNGRTVALATHGGSRLASHVRGHLRLWSLALPARSRAEVRRVTGLGAAGRRLFSAPAARRLTSYERFCRENPGAC